MFSEMFSENQSTVLREPEHGSPRTGARFSENQSTVLREPEHGSPRTGARFPENQRAPKLENRRTPQWRTFPCSPRAPNLLHVLPSRMERFMHPWLHVPVMKSMVERAEEREFWSVANPFKVIRVNRPGHHLQFRYQTKKV